MKRLAAFWDLTTENSEFYTGGRRELKAQRPQRITLRSQWLNFGRIKMTAAG